MRKWVGAWEKKTNPKPCNFLMKEAQRNHDFGFLVYFLIIPNIENQRRLEGKRSRRRRRRGAKYIHKKKKPYCHRGVFVRSLPIPQNSAAIKKGRSVIPWGAHRSLILEGGGDGGGDGKVPSSKAAHGQAAKTRPQAPLVTPPPPLLLSLTPSLPTIQGTHTQKKVFAERRRRKRGRRGGEENRNASGFFN